MYNDMRDSVDFMKELRKDTRYRMSTWDFPGFLVAYNNEYGYFSITFHEGNVNQVYFMKDRSYIKNYYHIHLVIGPEDVPLGYNA